MMKFMRAALAGAVLMMAAGCASMVTGGPLIRPGEPTGAIDFYNGSPQNITVVLISDCSASTYGLNRLPDDVSIPPGGTYRFPVSAGCWDVMGGHGTPTGYAQANNRIQVGPGQVTRFGVR